MRNLSVLRLADVPVGAQVVVGMHQHAAAQLTKVEPDPDEERFYINWEIRTQLARYAMRPADVAYESIWTVLSAHNDGKWVELRLGLAVRKEDGNEGLTTWDLCERASTKVEVLAAPV